MSTKLFISAYRLSHFFTKNQILRIVGLPIRILYKILKVIFAIDLSDKTRIGKNFKIDHGFGLVINYKTVIGNNVRLRNSTTIGVKKANDSLAPKIGNNVDIGANSILIGDITIGDNVIIGAGSVVINSIPSNEIWAGNPRDCELMS